MNLNASIVVESVGGGGDVAIELSGPSLAELAEEGAAGVVHIGIFGEQEDGENFFFALVCDGGEVEVGDGHGLVDELVGGQLGAASHEV